MLDPIRLTFPSGGQLGIHWQSKDMISEKPQRNGFKYYNEGRLLDAADLRFSMS